MLANDDEVNSFWKRLPGRSREECLDFWLSFSNWGTSQRISARDAMSSSRCKGQMDLFPRQKREFSKTKKAKLWINLDGMHEWRRRMAPEEQSFPVQQDACRRCLVKYIYQTVYRVHIYRIYFYLTLFTKENCLPCSQAKSVRVATRY